MNSTNVTHGARMPPAPSEPNVSCEKRPTPTMLMVLRLAAQGQSLTKGCNGRSEHGGRHGAIYALRRAGMLAGELITAAGLEAIDADVARAQKAMARLLARGQEAAGDGQIKVGLKSHVTACLNKAADSGSKKTDKYKLDRPRSWHTSVRQIKVGLEAGIARRRGMRPCRPKHGA